MSSSIHSRPSLRLSQFATVQSSRAKTGAPLQPKLPNRRFNQHANGLQAPKTRVQASHSPDALPTPPSVIADLDITLGGQARHEALRSMPTQLLYDTADYLCTHPDPMTRRDVVHALLQRPSDQALPMLAVFAQDPDASVRHSVAQCPWPEATNILVHLSQDENDFVAQAAAHSLGDTQNHHAIIPLAAVLEAGNPWQRRAAVQALAHLPTRMAFAAIATALEDENPWIRHAAVRALSRCPGTQVNAAIADMVQHDTVPWVRQAAMRTLVVRNRALAERTLTALPEEARTVLQHVLTENITIKHEPPIAWFEDIVADPHADVLSERIARQTLRRQAATMLTDVHGEADIPHGLAIFDTIGVNETLAATLQQHHLPLPELLPLIDSVRTSIDPDVRARAPSLIAHFTDDPATVPMLATLVDDPDAQVRAALATTLKVLAHQLKDPNIILPLVNRLLQDPLDSVRENVVYALRAVGTPQTQPQRLMAAHDPYHLVRDAAVQLLRECRTDEGWQGIQRLAFDTHPQVRSSVATTLRYAPSFAQAYSSLLELAGDPTPEVRAEVARTLVSFARNPDTHPVNAEIALRLLDSVAMDTALDSEALPAIHDAQSMVLARALKNHANSPEMVSMLHRWAQDLRCVDRHGAMELARSDYPRRHEILKGWLDNPAQQVRHVAREVMAAVLDDEPLQHDFSPMF